MDVVNLDNWIGRMETGSACLDPNLAARVAATLGYGATAAGAALPPLWHWYAFVPDAPMDELGADGHPRLGGFLPAIPRARRMWAAGALTFHRPLHIGEMLTRRSVVRDVAQKSGASGEMIFVTLDHEIDGEDGTAITETQDIVYLPMPDRFVAPKKRAVPDGAQDLGCFAATEALLFRFSAITFNAHRIHYDLPYAQEVEHYPGLVVHGPLQAQLLMREATIWKGRGPTSFSFRGVHPLFHQTKVRLLGQADTPQRLELCTSPETTPEAASNEMPDGGYTCLTATASWEN